MLAGSVKRPPGAGCGLTEGKKRQHSLSFSLCIFGYLILIGGFSFSLTADSVDLSGDEILAKIEAENNRRHILLKEYSGSRKYTLQNRRFGKQAVVAVLMTYRQVEGEHYTVLTRSGSDKLNGIIDRVLASETSASAPLESVHHQITSANYRVHLSGAELVEGRNCYILDL